MAEYINKEEALGRIYHDLYGDVFDIIEMIETEPTIDIVHCSECKHYEVNRCWRRLVDCNPTPDWFCGDGSQKAETGKEHE